MNIAIVVVTYNRASSLERLLCELAKADYEGSMGITLIISIDKSECLDVKEVAELFFWQHGEKRIIEHKIRLGLRNHILKCGDLSWEFDAIIMLEDDIVVSPAFFSYCKIAAERYSEDEQVCQISLYAYAINEFVMRRFVPINDGYDNYFMQVPSSWGQLWTKRQWMSFRKWYDEQSTFTGHERLPPAVVGWSESSWKKYYMKYMVENNLFAVFPRQSVTTNCGERGQHMEVETGIFQVPLLYGKKKYSLSSIVESSSVYDAFMEPVGLTINKMCPEMAKYNDIEADFYGSKPLSSVRSKYLISPKKIDKPIAIFGDGFIPALQNLNFDGSGGIYSLGESTRFKDFLNMKKKALIISREYSFGMRTAAVVVLYRMFRKIFAKLG